MKRFQLIICLILSLSCVFQGVDNPYPTSTSSGVTGPSVTITSIQAIGTKLIINGNNLSGVSGVVINTPTPHNFEVTSAGENQVVSENLDNISFQVNQLLELVLSSAQGASSYPITFTLGPDAVNTVNIKGGAITATKFKGVTTDPAFGTVPTWVSDGSGGGYFLFSAPSSGGGGGGSVTSILPGEGIIAAPNPISTVGTISVNKGTSGDPGSIKIPFFNHSNQLEIFDLAKLYFSTNNGQDNNFAVYNDGAFAIAHESTSTGTNDYLIIDPNGRVDIPFSLMVGPNGGYGSLMVGGKSVCLSDGTNCFGTAGDVKGPATSTAGGVPSFADTLGKLLSNNTKLVADLVTGPATAIPGDLAQLDATGKIISDSNILAANVPTMLTAAVFANSPILSGGSSKALVAAPYTFPNTVCPNGQILKSNATNFLCMPDLSGTGNVTGPSSPTSGNFASFNGTTGTLIQDSLVATNNVVTMPTATAVLNELLVSAGANKSIQSSFILSTDLVTMSANASATDFILLSSGASKVAKASAVSINNVVTMATPTTNSAEVLVSDGMFSRAALGSGVALANIPTMATNSTGANYPIMSVAASKALKGAPYSFPGTNCSTGQILKTDASGNFTCQNELGFGTVPGDVLGPASSTATDLAYFNNATGKLIADSGIPYTNVVTMTSTPAPDRLLSSTGAGKGSQGTSILSTDVVTMSSNASGTDYVLSSAGAKAAKDSGILSTNLVTMGTASVTLGNILTTAGGKSVQDSLTSLSNIPTMAANGTAGNLLYTAAGDKAVSNSGIVAANVVTKTSDFTAANRVALAGGVNKTLGETAYTIPATDGTANQYLATNGAGAASWTTLASTANNVTNAATSTDNAIARFDLATGKIIQNSGVIIDDSNNITGVAAFTSSGNMTVDTNTLFVNATNNEVGIGTLVPFKPLDVLGDITTSFHGNSNQHNAAEVGNRRIGLLSGGGTAGEFTGMQLNVSATDSTGAARANSSNIAFYTWGNSILASREVARITEFGRLGIGTTNPSEALSVVGNTTMTGSLTINNNGTNSSSFPTGRGTNGQYLSTNGAGTLSWTTSALDPNAVSNAGGSTDNAIPRFDLATGKVIQNSGVIISDTNAITGVASIVSGGQVDGGQSTMGANTGLAGTWGCFSNNNFPNSSTSYSLCQDDTGTSLLNAPTGQTVQNRINNSAITTVSSTGLAVTGTLSSSGAATVVGLTSNGNAAVTGNLSSGTHTVTGSLSTTTSIQASTTVQALTGLYASTNTNDGTPAYLYWTNNRGAIGDMRATVAVGGNTDGTMTQYMNTGGWGYASVYQIQTNAPPFVYFYGSLSVAGITNRSSAILKKNISPLMLDSSFMDKFSKINVVKYQWRDKPYIGRKIGEELTDAEKETKWHFGFVAEELSTLFPDLFDDGTQPIMDYNSEGVVVKRDVPVKAYSSADVAAILVKVVQEQQKAINALVNGTTPTLGSTSSEKNQQMEKRIEALEGKSVVQQLGPDLSFNQNRLYLRPEEVSGGISENENLKREVALLRQQNQRIQKQLDAINARLNPNVSSD